MNTLTKVFSILAAILLLLSACIPQAVQTRSDGQSAAQASLYEDLVGRSLTDQQVAEFLVTNNCSDASQFQLCKEIGMALWVGSNRIVEIVYLYLNNVEGFEPYRGELPYGLKFYDIKEAVEYKLKRQSLGNGGMPDEGATPDHLHYWATYHQAGLTIIYNSPLPEDEDATIYAILINR